MEGRWGRSKRGVGVWRDNLLCVETNFVWVNGGEVRAIMFESKICVREVWYFSNDYYTLCEVQCIS